MILIVHCKVMHYAQACFSCGYCRHKSVSVVHAVYIWFAPARYAFFGACRQVFAYIFIRLFTCALKRPLYWSVVHKNTFMVYFDSSFELNHFLLQPQSTEPLLNRYSVVIYVLTVASGSVSMCVFVCGNSIMCF